MLPSNLHLVRAAFSSHEPLRLCDYSVQPVWLVLEDLSRSNG